MRYFELNLVDFCQDKGVTDLLFTMCTYSAVGTNADNLENLRTQNGSAPVQNEAPAQNETPAHVEEETSSEPEETSTTNEDNTLDNFNNEDEEYYEEDY